MPFNDLREYIARLEQEGEVQKINAEVQPVFEVGAIIRRSYDLRVPAPFFLNLRGYPGYRIFGAPIGLSRQKSRTFARFAISMGMKPESSPMEIIEEYIRRVAKPIKPVIVKDGPCKENILIGDEIDLHSFPAPILHQGDGGPYLGTWHANITKDPDSEVRNWGLYRLMVHDKKTMGGLFLPAQNIGIHYYTKYEPRGRPMEFAIAMGTEPVTPWVAGTRFPVDVSEADIIGAIRRAPLELVKCETVDLEVPATSEIVIEGFVPPHERKEEGPFGEYTGFMASDRAPRPVYHVTAITHRDDPILPVTCMGVPVDDSAVSLSLTKAANILDEIRRQGFPVKAVYCPPEAVSHWTVVSTKVPYPGYARHLAQAIWGTGWGRSGWYLVITEEDIDPTDMGQVLWAISTMCHPKRGIVQVENVPGHPLLPFLSPEEKSKHIGAYALFDCTWPREWPREAIPVKASFDNIWPKEVQEKILTNWRAYGYLEKDPLTK
ncbi:MAG: UbiD family decarboxylase [Verrucomicrobia bacterium]|nr:MAG: UbiD family decarboxylase [Verrucomicrobiota bacterium]